MSTLSFDLLASVIVVNVVLKAKHPYTAKLVLDTGSSFIVLPWALVTDLGLTIDQNNTVVTTTASMVETVPEISIPEVTFLDKTAKNVRGIVKDLPPESGVDGLLGLSFLKHFKLTIDFAKGLLTLD